MLGRKLETDSPGVHKLKALSKILLKSATASENFYDLHCAGFCGENLDMHNTKSWFLGCGEWTLSHLQDQQQTDKRNLRELQSKEVGSPLGWVIKVKIIHFLNLCI